MPLVVALSALDIASLVALSTLESALLVGACLCHTFNRVASYPEVLHGRGMLMPRAPRDCLASPRACIPALFASLAAFLTCANVLESSASNLVAKVAASREAAAAARRCLAA